MGSTAREGRKPLLTTCKHCGARLSRPPQARQSRCLDWLVTRCYFQPFFVYHSKCLKTIAMADFQQICHPHILPKSRKYFVISLDSPHERMKWALVTERYGFDAPEFDCRDIREMIRYVNSIGPELQKGVIPPFIAEKDAVTAYARQRGEPEGLHIYRDGEHHYSYTSRKDRRKRTVLAAASLEDAPAGFVSEQAHAVKGMYLYCPEDVGVPLPGHPENIKKSREKKGVER